MTAKKWVLSSATARRAKKLGGALLFGTVFCLVLGTLGVLFFGVAVAVIAYLLAASLFFFCVYFFRILGKIKKNADRYVFTVTKSASFECFGLLLAMNVTFSDESGALREGRSRFLFSARDVEAWQNSPLMIGYLPFGKERGRKADTQPNAEIIVVGSVPKVEKDAEGENFRKS